MLASPSPCAHAQYATVRNVLWCALNTIFASTCSTSLVHRSHPSAREKGLVTIAQFLVCVDSAVLNSRKPIRLQVCDLSCDKHAIAYYDA